jgi:ribose transport system permease protein
MKRTTITARRDDETAAEQTERTRPELTARRHFDFEPYALLVTWIGIIVLFAVLRPATFLSGANISATLSSQSVLVVVAVAVLAPLIVGDLDVSVGSVVGLSAMLVCLLNVNDGMNGIVAAVVAVVASSLVGLLNGVIATTLNVDLLIVTLGTGSLVTGIVAWISSQQTITGLSPTLEKYIVSTQVLGVSPEFFYGILLVVCMFYLLRYTPVGRRMLIVGQAREVAALSGINVKRVRLGSLVLCSTLAGVAGVLYAGTSGSASPTGGAELLLPAYAAAFLGATTITPGRFNAFGTLIAVYFLVTGITGLQLLGTPNFVQQLFYGGALIIAVSVSVLVRIRRQRSS